MQSSIVSSTLWSHMAIHVEPTNAGHLLTHWPLFVSFNIVCSLPGRPYFQFWCQQESPGDSAAELPPVVGACQGNHGCSLWLGTQRDIHSSRCERQSSHYRTRTSACCEHILQMNGEFRMHPQPPHMPLLPLTAFTRVSNVGLHSLSIDIKCHLS